MNQKKSGNKTLLYVALGCGGGLLLIAVVVGALVFFGARWVKDLEADMKDPVAREAKVKRILGAETLPDGYYPAIALSFPFVMDMATLSRTPTAAGEEPDNMDFIYFKMLSFGDKDQEMRDFFNGANDNPSVLEDAGVNVNIDEVVRRGELQVGNQDILWLTSQGRIQTGLGRGHDLATILMIRCPGDKKTRMGIWVEDDVVESTEEGELQLEGTVGDPKEIEAFMGYFSLC
jgi:hypothetical protein